MIKIIAIAGAPATGKTTLMRKLMEKFGAGLPLKRGLVAGTLHKETRSVVLGIYDSGTFAGTDRLSMAVQPNALELLRMMHASKDFDGWTVWMEGDRLTNISFFNSLAGEGIPHTVVFLEASDQIKNLRHAARDNQDPNWLKGRETKVARLASNLPGTVQRNYAHNYPVDTEYIVECLLHFSGVGK